MKKYKAARSFFWKIKNGKRVNIQKGKVYDLTDDEYQEIGAFGIYPFKEDKKEEVKK